MKIYLFPLIMFACALIFLSAEEYWRSLVLFSIAAGSAFYTYLIVRLLRVARRELDAIETSIAQLVNK